MTPLRVTQPALNLLSKQLCMRGFSDSGLASEFTGEYNVMFTPPHFTPMIIAINGLSYNSDG